MKIRDYIKSLLALKGMTITKLAKMMTEKTGKKYDIQILSGRLGRETITVREFYIIAELIGYEIKLIEKK